MSLRPSSLFVAVALAILLAAAAPGFAAPINYGDFSDIPPGSVMYLDVTETANTPGDTEPLFGAPSITGNSLDFDPAGFTASAAVGSADLTDGQLNFTLMGSGGRAVTSILLSESGDYTVAGVGTTVTQAISALSIASVKVLEVDGQALRQPVALGGASVSQTHDLSNGPAALALWENSLFYDVNAALTAANVQFDAGATKLEIAIDNLLTTISEASSVSYIAKKDFEIQATTASTAPTPPADVPEPGALVLFAVGLVTLRSVRRARA